MTTRKRKNTTPSSENPRRRSRRSSSDKRKSRQHLLETLEARQLLAGPQLIGIQPNEGALIVDGSVRDTAPRLLTVAFDQAQVIDPATLTGIRVTRSGEDGLFNTEDDVPINPGLVSVGDPNQNEVVVRFVESLPDDKYRIEVFGFDDAGLGVVGVRNTDDELFVPSDPTQRSEIIDFELKLGALVEAVVPQPVIRDGGDLVQNRNEIVVYFNEDPLFVEDDANGNPTERSAENPRFYQLLFTQETVRTTDDLLFHPDEVVYDQATHTARLFFDGDINDLPGVPVGGGTWRLRIGTAVDDRVDLILPPTDVPVQPSAITDFQHDGLRVEFFSNALGEGASGTQVRFIDTGIANGGLSVELVNNVLTFDFGGTTPSVSDLSDAIVANLAVSGAVGMRFERDGVAGAGGDLLVPQSVLNATPLAFNALGDTLETSLDIGIFGQFNELKSLVFTESISPQQFDIELPGGQDDPGHTDEVNHINPLFGADTLPGITEIAYNFQGIFDTDDVTGDDFLNQITPTQKTRIREALNLWSNEIGVQFRETQNEGITFALGDVGDLQSRNGLPARQQFVLDASVRIDPDFVDSAIVFSNQAPFQVNYGEDFTRKAVAGIGLLLGLNQASDLSAPTIMSFSTAFLERSIDLQSGVGTGNVEEPVFPNNEDILHGQFVHRPESNDVDLYRFEVDLNDADKVGTLTAETFAERLPDSSLLDTTLTLYKETTASITTDFGIGTNLAVDIQALVPGINGNNSRLEVIRTDRLPNDIGVRILPAFDDAGVQLPNAVIIDMPRLGQSVSSVTAGQVVDAINADPLSASLFRATITTGDASTEVGTAGLSFSPLLLSGGGLEQLNRNDDYFGEDSRIVTSLGEGVYYLGVASTGNDQYDPTITQSGFGGRTQGNYELQLKFEPQVDEVDVIRDLDSPREDVPGTVLDGDGDGTPGGAHNFWFQTRPLNRILEFTDSGDAITPGQTITVVGANNAVRTFQFIPGGSPDPGNVPVSYTAVGSPTPAGNLASLLQAAINARSGELGVTVNRNGSSLEFTGERSVSFSTDFRGANALGRNIFVDKTASPEADGSLEFPFNNIADSEVANAFDSAIEGDIVRIVGNGGLDGDITTEDDNFSYQIGVADVGGVALDDGRNMEVPRGVTTMIDAGAIFKLRNSFIGIGSSTVQVDRSGGALQVLGTPRLVQLSPENATTVTTTLISGVDEDAPGFDDGSVIFTSVRDRDADTQAAGISVPASSGNWGGIIFRRDIDQGEGRRDLEDEGIFLQRINHAEIRYGGSSGVLIGSVQQLVNPIQIVNMRPTVTFNEITQSADSAISAAPNSFEETSYQAPVFQQGGQFTADYDRVGPDINNNLLIDNSINGLFIRATTTPTETPREFTVAGRLDDIDVVHYVAENLIVASNPGGSIQDGFAPSMNLVSGQELAGGTLPVGTYEYKLTFVDANGFESLESADSTMVDVTAANSSIELTSLPQIGTDTDYVSRRLYRATQGVNQEFRLVADLDASSIGFIDSGTQGESVLDLDRDGVRGRLDASLVLDPGLIVKLRGARIELGHGTQLLAEGLGSNPVVFTSSLDDRFGAGGTFDTNNDNETITGAAIPQRGDWSGIYAGPTANVSLDNVRVAYAGGISLIEGGLARGFLPLELQQADGRITNSVFEFNDQGQQGAGPRGRFGRLAVNPATIFSRGTQPIIVGNTFVDNRGSIIDMDIEAFGGNYRVDTGRQTGGIDRFSELDDNFGPLIRFNRYLNDPSSGSQLSGVEIRGGTIRTQTVFDDTDIAHLVFDNIQVDNFHSSGGLRLQSRPDESLVVKFNGAGSPTSDTSGTGITATGSTAGIADRIGGTVHVIGLPGAPVILTSLQDDTAGAGLKPDGSQFTDHDGDGTNTRPFANDWRGIYLDQNSNDTNLAVLPELELSTEVAPGLNGNVDNAQFLGELAQDELRGDHVRRLGFDVQGFLSGNTDIDVYSFIGSPGSEVWIDIDETSFGLDTVIELLDEDGRVLARSNDSFAETAEGGGTDITIFDPDLEGVTTSLQARNEEYTARGAGNLYEDFNSTNIYDAGIHFRLAGNTSDPNLRSLYFFRVRSNSINPDDPQGGTTGGGYRFQVRLREDQEFPGSVVRYADIRYANHGIHVQGLMSTSPLLGEAQENEGVSGQASNDAALGSTPGNGGQYIGNIANNTNNVISVGGSLSSGNDIDFYQFDVDYATTGIHSTIFDIDYAAGFNRPDTNISVFWDQDGVDSGNFQPRLIYFGSASNIVDDQTSPGGEDSGIERLLRGSVSTDDPLIGPVILPEGSYFVAVTADGRVPAELETNVREPVNSVDRIIEDRIDRVGAETPSTADGPLLDRLFSDASINGSVFEIATDVSIGHGKPQHIDGSSGPVAFSGATRFPEGTFGPGFDADNDLVSPYVVGSNLENGDFSLADDFDIGGRGLFNGSYEFTATTIPHISVSGDLQSDPADIYQFTVPDDGFGSLQRVILDIDDGYNSNADVDSDGDFIIDTNLDPTSVDTTLILIREDAGTLTEVARATDEFPIDFFGEEGANGSNSELDPYLDTLVQPGNYYVVVMEATAAAGAAIANNNGADEFITTPADPTSLNPDPQTYVLHVSVEEHPLPTSAFQLIRGEDVLSFDRLTNDVSGSITSDPFDLTGYVAEDLPTLYFNRIFEPVRNGGLDDTATLTATSDDLVGTLTLHTFGGAGSDNWGQIRLSLAELAGHSNIQLTVNYNTNGQSANPGPFANESGLRLDDFIIGFAERGETVFGASSDIQFVGSGFGAGDGEYQLEIRRGTEYASVAGFGSIDLDESYDTNERHTQSVTLIAPDGSQVNAGDTFVLGDGAANQTFEFTTPGRQVTFGNTPVVFNFADSSSDIAESLRSAINSQTQIAIEASSASGLDTQDLTDGRLTLSGNATGTFEGFDSAAAVPATPFGIRADGHLAMPALLHDGTGDSNFLRRQGQVIVEHNVISDVRGIGIWSEPGQRDANPNHDFNNSFIGTPPLGNAYPGAVRNLPTLNNSVLGGIAPGIVIQNNTIDQAEYTGIKVDGQISPWAIAPPSGDMITDGTTFAIDAAGTRVVFEFEDIGDGEIPSPRIQQFGSAVDGGDGVRDGHVPVYYRDLDPDTPVYRGRSSAYTAAEVAHSILQSIQGSILVSNGLVRLVRPSIGPSLVDPVSDTGSFFGGFLGGNFFDFTGLFGFDSELTFEQPAVYIEGASGIYLNDFNPALQSVPEIEIFQSPIHEAPQPFARIINNTIYGDDGRESAFPGNALVEPNDFLNEAIETNAGSSHRDAYTDTAFLGDNSGPLAGAGDIDFYEVYLEVGDRLIADIDTVDANPGAGTPPGPDTSLRVFDASGITQSFTDSNGDVQIVSNNDSAPAHLEPLTTVYGNQVTDPVNSRDPFIDFTAPKTGIYYVGVSSASNITYDPTSLADRIIGTGGTGEYDIAIEVHAPRSHVISLQNGSGDTNNNSETDRGGSTGGALLGTSFTVTLPQDLDIALPQSDGTNQVEFVFDAGPYRVLGPGRMTVPIQDTYRLPDIMVAIELALTGLVNGMPALPNGGPIPSVDAEALGGPSGAGAGTFNQPGLYLPDFNTGGFGHAMNIGSTEQYTFVEKVANIQISPAAAAAGLRLDPLPDRDTDQAINEAGVIAAGGSSPTLLNNVFLNLHESVFVEETRKRGFGRGPDLHPKAGEVIVVGSVFQHNEPALTQLNQDMHFGPLNPDNSGITTGGGITNINGGSDDFNITLAGVDPAVQFAEGSNFQPDFASILIDSSVSSLVERAALVDLRTSVGLPVSNIVAPTLDVSGILRADNPDFAPPGGIGASIFNDRGSSELADFVGPIAIAELPRDNDAQGIDSDPAVSFINLTGGVYEEFRIQLRDTGDASDPFTGIGIDDSSVIVPEVDGLRSPGANITLFENDRALVEGVDYTFNYDETKNIITLTPLAGIWQNDRAYRVALNNQDRNVLIAADPAAVEDGGQFSITDDAGGTVVFEFETGYQLLMPEVITLTIPPQGTNAGGVRDGETFQIDDGVNLPVVFEYNSDAAQVPGTIAVPLPSEPTPVDPAELQQFLNQIALATQTAIQNEIDLGNLDLDLRVAENSIFIGAERGAIVASSRSGLVQSGRTLGLNVPVDGAGSSDGVQVGETFEISNGVANIVFEFIDNNNPVTAGNVAVDLTSTTGTPLTQAEVAIAIQRAVDLSPLNVNPQLVGSTVYLNLPEDGSALVNSGLLRVVGVSRTPIDGDTIVFTPDDGSAELTFEVNRTDEPDGLGGVMDDGVAQQNFPINVTRLTTGSEFAATVANSVQEQVISGLNPNEVQVGDAGLLTIGGQQGLGLSVTGTSLEVVGAPSVTGASTIQVFGPLLLNIPLIASLIQSGQVVTIEDNVGNVVLFEFVLDQAGFTPFFDGTPDANGVPKPVSNVVLFNTFDTNDIIAANFAAAVNTAGIGVAASAVGNGQVSLGRIERDRVNTQGDLAAGIPGANQVTVQRGIVTDQEILSIRQGTTQVDFEFEEVTNGGGVTPGNIPVVFQAGSTVGDVANSLAAAINNNRGTLRVFAQAAVDDEGNLTGEVILNDIPGTIIDVTLAPTLNIVGVPGGAIPVRISSSFGANEVATAILTAINSINTPGQLPATTLSAQERGGPTLFVENATLFSGAGIRSFFLPGIKDQSGNLLEANRDDFTTQFTILMPTVGLDFGDAPDPALQVQGRYPTRLVNDGPRHAVDESLMLGTSIDIDLDGRPVFDADGDDSVIEITNGGSLFLTTLNNGVAEIRLNTGAVIAGERDGDTITIDTGVSQATLELDLDGIFNEDNFAIRPATTSGTDIAQAITEAIAESPLGPASVSVLGSTVFVSADDEDGVVLSSDINPSGILNKGVETPIEVTVTGAGILEAWVDFNADGDWEEAGEQIISASTPGAIFSDTGGPVTRTFTIVVPETTADPVTPQTTYARFRVSREGGLEPTGLALSGEVEDYALLLLPGSPPQLSDAQANRTFTISEGLDLFINDETGTGSPSQLDNGLLAGVVDPQGNAVSILPADTGQRNLMTPGGVFAGVLDLAPEGTFRFTPEPDFNGSVSFTARVTDIHPLDPSSQIVNIRPITATIDVLPVNDPPFATGVDVEVSRPIDEDQVQIFDAAELIDPFFLPGPENELSQELIIQSVSSFTGENGMSTQGGTVEIINDGKSVRYTPALNNNGEVPDTFTYVVADVVDLPLTSESAITEGTVSITINPVNDAPIARSDAYTTDENQILEIPITGNGTTVGILDNDSPGPANESDQTVSVVDPVTQFPVAGQIKETFQGGTVVFNPSTGTLTYSPAPFFSGDDSFTYAVTDGGIISEGTVFIRVGGVNNGPRFIGINGEDPDVMTLPFFESKETPQQFSYDLNTWFSDPESDNLTFTVSSSNTSIVQADLDGDELTLVLPSFSPGSAELDITVDDGQGGVLVTVITVNVTDTPDAPVLVGEGLVNLVGQEDQNLITRLGGVFFDPDALPRLEYEVVQVGDLIGPTPAQLAEHFLIQSIDFPGNDTMVIVPQPNVPQAATDLNSVSVTIRATDGTFDAVDTFDVEFTAVPDSPIALGDSYNVPVRSFLQVLNPADGLLRNDTDADGDEVFVDLSVSPIIAPQFGTLTLNEDGTFVYQNTDGVVGQADTFTYRTRDASGAHSSDVVVSLRLNQSRFQNPINDLVEDVTANGIVSPLDALRIINFLSDRRIIEGDSFTGQVPVNVIATSPPDYLDVTGDGLITPFDALAVINRLSEEARAQRGFGELIASGPGPQGEQVESAANFAVTTAFATPSNLNLPVTNQSPADDSTSLDEEGVRDQLLTNGLAITSNQSQVVADAVATTEEFDEESSSRNVDEALTDLYDLVDESLLDGSL